MWTALWIVYLVVVHLLALWGLIAALIVWHDDYPDPHPPPLPKR